MSQGSSLVNSIEGLVPVNCLRHCGHVFITLFHATRAAPQRSVTQADRQAFGDVPDGV